MAKKPVTKTVGSKNKVRMTFIPPTRTKTDIAIEERLAACGRKEAEHIIYVGELVERVIKSEFGAVLKALTAGRTSAELAANRDSKLSSDRILGRIEMADSLWNDLEQFVLDKDSAVAPLMEETKESFTEPEPIQRADANFTWTA